MIPKKTEPTPGPWTVVDGWVNENERGLICVEHATFDALNIAMSRQSQEPEEHEANARLIAAAPDLYAALKTVERNCPCGARPESPNSHPHVGGCPVFEALRRVGNAKGEWRHEHHIS